MQKLEVSDEVEIAEVARDMGLLDGGKNSVPAHQKDALPILLTKLQPPSLPTDVVPRLQLVARFDELRSRSFTLVSAGAGFGKSTLARLWLEAWDGPAAWVSLDEEENDLQLFVAYLLAAIQTMFPEACDTTRSLLQGSSLPPVSVLGRYLLNDLVEIGDPFILVLDDYHRIREKRVHDLMAELLAHPPKSMHLMLLTRKDPPLITHKLRGRDQLTVFGISELRFTEAETADFLGKTTDISIDDRSTAAIHGKLEGWPAGMRLVSQSLRHLDNVDHLLKGLKGGSGVIMDYLVSEVLLRQSPEIASLMMETAILNRFCAPLCDALQGPDPRPVATGIDGAAFIARLQTDNLFLIALDIEKRWFRFHHLFQQLLKDQLKRRRSPEEIAGLHLRAAEWFDDQGFIEEAIEHALAAGDALAAARIVERNRRAALDADQWHVLGRWLDKLSPEIKQKRPGLLLSNAWIKLQTAQVPGIVPLIERVEALVDEDSIEPALLSEINFFRGLLCYFKKDGERSVAFLAKAMELLPKGAFLALRSVTEYWLSVALHLNGQKETAIRRLRQRILSSDSREGMMMSRQIFGLCFIHLLDGEYLQALQEGLRLRKLSMSNRLVFAETWGMYVQGNTAFQMFDLDAARQHLSLVLENRYLANPRAAVDAMAGLALTRHFMGKPEDADETIRLAQEYAEWTNESEKLDIVASCRARLALLRGDIDSAAQWQGTLRETPGRPIMLFFLELPAVTKCRVLIAMGSDAGLKGAMERLKDIYTEAKAWRNTCWMMEILSCRPWPPAAWGN